MRTYLKTFPTAAVACFLVGCASQLETQYAGTWSAPEPPPLGKSKNIVTGKTFTLVTKAGKSFTLTMGPTIAGKWQVGNGDMLALIAATIGGKPGKDYHGGAPLPDFTQPVGLGSDADHSHMTLTYGGSANGPKMYAVFTKPNN